MELARSEAHPPCTVSATLVAELVTGRNWFGSLSPTPPPPPPRTVPIVPVDRCTASDPESAWRGYQIGALR